MGGPRRRRRAGGRPALGRLAPLLLLSGAAVAALLRLTGGGGLGLRDAVHQRPRPGLEVLTASLHDGAGVRGRLVALFIDPSVLRVAIRVAEEPSPLDALADGSLAAVNAGYFTEAGRPTGLLMSGGEVLHRFVARAGGAGSGVLVIEDAEVSLLDRDHVEPKRLRGADLAIQAGPRVLEPDGSRGIRSDDGRRANRTVIGRDKRGWLALVVVHGSDSGFALGPTLFELQFLLQSGLAEIDPRLALDFALNLDGGPSTGLRLETPRIELPAKNRIVSAIVVTTPDE